ncbi:MAG: hypothetical protein VR69_11690 [Peptococcaceae bacterium BRH_c4b]|nr:MAG: hypothetical protein VR69_11690 [Peptococcaceae bacterium BRH_c4b]
MPVTGIDENLQNQRDILGDFPPWSADDIIGQEEQYFDKSDVCQIENAVKQINNTMEMYHTELKYSLHEESGEYYVKVINTEDNTVIREIPPEKVLDMVAYFKKMLGIIVDKFI